MGKDYDLWWKRHSAGRKYEPYSRRCMPVSGKACGNCIAGFRSGGRKQSEQNLPVGRPCEETEDRRGIQIATGQ